MSCCLWFVDDPTHRMRRIQESRIVRTRSWDDETPDSARPYALDRPTTMCERRSRRGCRLEYLNDEGQSKGAGVDGLVPLSGTLLHGILEGVLVTLHRRLVLAKIHEIVPVAFRSPSAFGDREDWCRWIGVADASNRGAQTWRGAHLSLNAVPSA